MKTENITNLQIYQDYGEPFDGDLDITVQPEGDNFDLVTMFSSVIIVIIIVIIIVTIIVIIIVTIIVIIIVIIMVYICNHPHQKKTSLNKRLLVSASD